jgi:hypothetical protein
MAVIITAGTTTPQRFQLLEDGVPLDLTGLGVTLLLQDRLGAVVATTAMVAVTVPATGSVEFTPATAGFFTVANSPYHARFVLTNPSTGYVSFVPNGLRDRWIVAAQ